MEINCNKHNIIKYLPSNADTNIWEISIGGIGFQSIDSKVSYPPEGHPIEYSFNPDRGRVIDEFALIYIVKGRGTFISTDCPAKKIFKGDFFVITPGQWHSYYPDPATGWDEYFITFKGIYFAKVLNTVVDHTNPIFHVGLDERIVKLFEEMLECASVHHSGFHAVLGGIVLHVIGLVYSLNKNQDNKPIYMQKIQEAYILMRENVYNKFAPEDIADTINMGYSNFRKLFKEYTGVPPYQYMIQLKLSKIKEHLSDNQLSIEEIASKFNFDSVDYFSSFFKNKVGMSPYTYRRDLEKQFEKAMEYKV